MTKENDSALKNTKICVFYDAACPSCQRDKERYDRLAGKEAIEWCDITNNDERLKSQGIDPQSAMIKLHVQKPDGTITNDIEAYILLFSEVHWLKPIAWILNISWVKETLRVIYRKWVLSRLKKDGRLNL